MKFLVTLSVIDDRPHKANCASFPGTLIHFREGNQWPEILDYFRQLKGARKS